MYFIIPVMVPLVWKIYPDVGKPFAFITVIVLGIGELAVALTVAGLCIDGGAKLNLDPERR